MMRIRQTDWLSRIAIGAACAGLGALLMYILDPDVGGRRRAAARRKALDAGAAVRDFGSGAAQDLRRRATGLFSRTRDSDLLH
jgi:hypothetical protein